MEGDVEDDEVFISYLLLLANIFRNLVDVFLLLMRLFLSMALNQYVQFNKTF